MRQRPNVPGLLFCGTLLLAAPPLRAGTDQPTETLPGFKANNVYQSNGIDHINLFSGDPGIVVPLGPEYPLSPGLTWQLRATYTSKIWTLDSFEGPPELRYAYVSGYPTLGVGWGLHLGFADSQSYASPTSGRHYFPSSTGTTISRDGSGLRRSGNINAGYTVEFPDGSKHVFGQPYYRPRPTPDNPSLVRDFNDDPWSGDSLRWGLTEIRDRFGTQVLTVEYLNYETGLSSDAWKIHYIRLLGRSTPIVWAWTTMNTGPLSWPVLASLSFPSANGSHAVSFERVPGSFVRNVFDTAHFWSENNPYPTDGTVNAPQLSFIRMNGSDGQGGSNELARYSFQYNGTDSGKPVANGVLQSLTLPTGGQVLYTYASTSSAGMNGYDLETVSCPGIPPALPLAAQGSESPSLGRFRRYLDNSAAVSTRTEVRSGVTYPATAYCRSQSAPFLSGTTVFDDDRVARQVTVSRPDGNGNTIATRHIFTVEVGHVDGEPSNAGLEMERRYYAGTNTTVNPIRTLVFCYESDGGATPNCGYKNTDGSMANFVGIYNIRRQKEATWYGASPTGGGDCGQVGSPACWQRASLDWNGSAIEYGTERISSNNTILFYDDTAPTSSAGRYRDLKTTWSPSVDPSHWLMKLYSSKTTEDHFASGSCPYSPCTETTSFTFNTSNGFLNSVSTTDASNSTLTHAFTMDAAGKGDPVSEAVSGTWSGAGSFVTNRTFQSGLPLTSTRSGLPVSWNSFDVTRDPATGLVTASRDPNGLVATYVYDALGRLTRVTPPDGEAPTTYCYQPWVDGTRPNAYVLAKKGYTDACGTNDGVPGIDSGSIEAYLFDGMGRLIKELRREPNPLSTGSYFAFRETTYNAAGLAGSVSEWTACPGTIDVIPCFGSTASYRTVYSNFDFLGRTRSITLPDGNTITKSFDDGSILNTDFTEFTTVGNVSGQAAYSGVRKNVLGQALVVTDPGIPPSVGTVACYRYNTFDKLVKVELPCETTTQPRSFSYDSFGFLRSETHPEKGTTTYSAFDALGNPRTKQEGIYSHSFTYDTVGRLLTLSSGGQSYIEYFYDGAPGPTAGYPKGRLTRSIGRNPSTAGGFSIQEDFTYAGPGGRLSDRQITVSPPSGPAAILVSERWVHNPLGLVQTHFHPRRAADPPFAASTGYRGGKPVLVVANGIPVVKGVSYQPSGALASYTTGNSTSHDVTTTIAADPWGMPRPRQISSTGASTNWNTGVYSYDGAGNILTIGADAFTYDALSRLTYANLGGVGSQSFTYDTWGNLTTRSGGPNPFSLTIDPATNRIPGTCSDLSARYDSLGNDRCPPGELIAYDPLSRATRSTVTGNTDYYYNATGERILRVNSSGSTYTFRDTGDRIATEYAGTTPSRDNVFLGSLLVGSYSNSTVSGNGPPWLYYSSDHLGTPRLLTDNLGFSVESRRSWPFGEDVTTPQPPQTFQRLRYATMERDPEGSRYYDHARSHSFGLARFMSPDKLGGKIGDPQSWNRYTYTRNNPLKYVDPDGDATKLAEAVAGAFESAGAAISGAGASLNGGGAAGVAVDTALSTLGGVVGGFGDMFRVGDSVGAVLQTGGDFHDITMAVTTDFVRSTQLFVTAGAAAAPLTGVGPKLGCSGGPGAGARFSEATKVAARAESGNCVFCGLETTRSPGPLQSNIDHAIAKAKGGNNTLANAQNTCRTCNLEKSTDSSLRYAIQKVFDDLLRK